MARPQAVVCSDAGDALGDSLYEAVIYVRGKVKSLAQMRTKERWQKPTTPHQELLARLA